FSARIISFSCGLRAEFSERLARQREANAAAAGECQFVEPRRERRGHRKGALHPGNNIADDRGAIRKWRSAKSLKDTGAQSPASGIYSPAARLARRPAARS